MEEITGLQKGYERLEKNLMDFIWEEQVKLGYRREVIRLYFPLASLCHFFGRQMSEEEMLDVMYALPETVTRTLGNVRCSSKKGRFCIEIPEDGVAYVHEHMSDDGFLEELIALVQTHDCSREKLLSLFGQYSQAVEIQDMQDADFDYAIHFQDREDDPYYYCFHEEGCHIIYHRFTPEDYADLIR